jgi:hypothetical protein
VYSNDSAGSSSSISNSSRGSTVILLPPRSLQPGHRWRGGAPTLTLYPTTVAGVTAFRERNFSLVGYSGLTVASTLARLGTGPLDQRVREMEQRAKRYADGREILPVLEVITTMVPGRDGRKVSGVEGAGRNVSLLPGPFPRTVKRRCLQVPRHPVF